MNLVYLLYLEILQLIWMIFNVLTCAMKDEPVNKIIFMDDVRFKGLIDTVKRLGCFSERCVIDDKTLVWNVNPVFSFLRNRMKKQDGSPSLGLVPLQYSHAFPLEAF